MGDFNKLTPDVESQELTEEKLWSSIFLDTYTPDFSFERFFSYIKGEGIKNLVCLDENKTEKERRISELIEIAKKLMHTGGYESSFKHLKHEKYRIIGEMLYEIEENEYILDDNFLESLDDEQKKYLSLLILKGIEKLICKDKYLESLFTQPTEEELKIIGEILHKIKENGYKLDIDFLESLNSEQKKYLSLLILKVQGKNINSNKPVGKSIFLWMIWYGICCNESNIPQDTISKILKDLSQNFQGFNSTYFMQAYNLLRNNGKSNINIFDIVKEYNLINNIDSFVHNPEMEKILSKGDSIKVFHATNESGEGEISGYKQSESGILIERTQDFLKHIMDNESEKQLNTSGAKKNPENKNFSWSNFNIYLDYPTGLGLFQNNELVAFISFYIKDGRTLVLKRKNKISYYERDKNKEFNKEKYYSQISNDNKGRDIMNRIISLIKKEYSITEVIEEN